MRAAVILAMLGLLIGGVALSAPAERSGQAFLWTGHNWQQISEEGKAGYIFGMGNLADFETAATPQENREKVLSAVQTASNHVQSALGLAVEEGKIVWFWPILTLLVSKG